MIYDATVMLCAVITPGYRKIQFLNSTTFSQNLSTVDIYASRPRCDPSVCLSMLLAQTMLFTRPTMVAIGNYSNPCRKWNPLLSVAARPPEVAETDRGIWGTKVCRYNWHSAGSLGWPFPILKYKYIFHIKYTEAFLSNSTRKLLWCEVTKMLIAV